MGEKQIPGAESFQQYLQGDPRIPQARPGGGQPRRSLDPASAGLAGKSWPGLQRLPAYLGLFQKAGDS